MSLNPDALAAARALARTFKDAEEVLTAAVEGQTFLRELKAAIAKAQEELATLHAEFTAAKETVAVATRVHAEEHQRRVAALDADYAEATATHAAAMKGLEDELTVARTEVRTIIADLDTQRIEAQRALADTHAQYAALVDAHAELRRKVGVA